MSRFKLLKVKQYVKDGYISILIEDTKKDIKVWIDCSLIDGYGNRSNFKTKELYLDWEFNMYIFWLSDENDLKIKEYQENADNIEEISYFIEEVEEKLIKEYFKK